MTAESIIERLQLTRHPEGGWYRRTWADEEGRGSAIYYLLTAGEESAWHRVNATELWHYYAGAPLTLRTIEAAGVRHEVRLGPAVLDGEQPQAIVQANAWQSARSTGQWTLVGATVTPEFTFEGFELAPPNVDPWTM